MCVNTYNDVLDDSKCSQQEKLTVQRCSDFSCPQWKTGDWSEVGAGNQDGLTLLVLHSEGLVPAKRCLHPCLAVMICLCLLQKVSPSLCTERLQPGSKVIGLGTTGQVATFLPAKPQGVNVSPILQ